MIGQLKRCEPTISNPAPDALSNRTFRFEPSWTSQPPIDFDRRPDYSHSSDYARRVADSLNSRSGLVDRGLVKLPSPPHRSAPYDLDSRPSRHDYRPILPTLPKLRPLICKMCDGSNGKCDKLIHYFFNNNSRIVHLLQRPTKWRQFSLARDLLLGKLSEERLRLAQKQLHAR